MKYLLLFSLLLSITAHGDNKNTSWLNPPKEYSYDSQISSNDVYEVVISKQEVAEFGYLTKSAFVEISESTAKSLVGGKFDRNPGQHTYLVRAVYTNGGTGAFSVSAKIHDLTVSHASLGASTGYKKSALVVNLNFEIENLYVVSGGAM